MDLEDQEEILEEMAGVNLKKMDGEEKHDLFDALINSHLGFHVEATNYDVQHFETLMVGFPIGHLDK